MVKKLLGYLCQRPCNYFLDLFCAWFFCLMTAQLFTLTGGTGKKGPLFALSGMFFWAGGAEKWKKLAIMTHFWRQGATNFKKSSKNSLIFVKFQDFISWKCGVMHKMTKKVEKSLYLGYFSIFLKWNIFENPNPKVTQPQGADINSSPDFNDKLFILCLIQYPLL